MSDTQTVDSNEGPTDPAASEATPDPNIETVPSDAFAGGESEFTGDESTAYTPTPDSSTTETVEAPVGGASATPDVEVKSPKGRRIRGALEADVKRVCDEFVTGLVALPEGELLTPHRIAKIVKDTIGDPEYSPSTGAVAAVLVRWKAIGFASLNEKPMAFLDYTDAGRTEGLTALKAASAEGKRAERKAAKAASTPAAPETPASATSDDATDAGGSEPAVTTTEPASAPEPATA